MIGLLLLALLGCGGQLTPIPGTTTRVSRPVIEQNTELELKIFADLDDCAATVQPADVPLCMPHVDRRSGQVRLGMQFRLDSDDFPLPLSEENLKVVHKGRTVQDGPGMSVEIVPHDPIDAPQLFILVIDGSSSMSEGPPGSNRMDRVRAALLTDGVRDAFFPKGGTKTGVVILSFTGGEPFPISGRFDVITDPREFRSTVREHLQISSGYTHLYDAVRYATGPLLQQEAIKTFIDIEQAAPTVVLLTDGFNNMAADDTCASNVPRLERILDHLQEARREVEDLRLRPTVFTVGLGRPLRPSFKLPETRENKVRALDLCGKRYKDQRIDGDLERYGIDNASLEFIANRGGGFSYVRRDVEGLAEAFQAAAARRYTWVEVRYRVDPHYLRRSFETRLRLLSFANAEASVRIFPSAWLDAPPGRVEADGRVVSTPFRHTATVLMPVFGLLLALGYVGAVSFNSSRILFGRARRPKAPPPRAPGPP